MHLPRFGYTLEPHMRSFTRSVAGAALPDVVAGQRHMMVDGPPQAFARYINSELTRWGEVVRAANIKIE